MGASPHLSLTDRYRGCLLGLAVGDAVGTTVEFKPRGTFHPVEDMVGGGAFELRPGQWTDDTSMALCLAASLVERNGFDPRDQMERYCRWESDGYMSSTGDCFDIGSTVRTALQRYRNTGEPLSGPLHADSAGNGCIMRLAPVALYFFPDQQAIVHYSGESSRTTHRTAECVAACRLLGELLGRALAGESKESVLRHSEQPFESVPRIAAISRGAYREKKESDIRGSGYVVESLEAALWCFHRTNDFASAILTAVNLGDDADTTGAVCGQIAGAYYGASGIPEHWRERVAQSHMILGLADRLRRES
jgi:ADP-ribosyl-[dinitrogen reductase] hydrolase